MFNSTRLWRINRTWGQTMGRLELQMAGSVDMGGHSPDTAIPADAANVPDLGWRSSAESLRISATLKLRPDISRSFYSSAGDFTSNKIALAPIRVDRFYNLVRSGYFDGIRFFRRTRLHRSVRNSVTSVSAVWRQQSQG